MDFIILGICLVVYIIYRASVNSAFDNYDMSNVDTTKIVIDRSNGVSAAEVRRRITTGYYEKDK